MAQEFAPVTGKLPLGSLPRNGVARINDCPDMISAVCPRKKATNPSQNKKMSLQC